MRKEMFNWGLILIILSIISLFVSTLVRKVGFAGPSVIFILCMGGLAIGIIMIVVSLFLKSKS